MSCCKYLQNKFVNYMPYPLCDKYRFDFKRRDIHLSLMGFSETDKFLADLLHRQVIMPNLDSIVNEFYEKLLAHRNTCRFLQKHGNLDNLKNTQREYLKSFMVDFDTAAYFESRLNVGLAHARIEMPLSYYYFAYRQLGDLIISYIPISYGKSPEKYRELAQFIIKAAIMDMSLAVETYYQKSVQQMSDSIDVLMGEKSRLSNRINRDELTGVNSRAHTFELLKERLQAVKYFDDKCSVAMLDVDHFKKINDNYGHRVGDQILQAIAKCIMQALRDKDLVGRYGGEEFVLILPGTELDVASSILERLRKIIEDVPFTVEGNEIAVTVSAGVASCMAEDEADEVLDRADKAMYQAKKQGRNQVITV